MIRIFRHLWVIIACMLAVVVIMLQGVWPRPAAGLSPVTAQVGLGAYPVPPLVVTEAPLAPMTALPAPMPAPTACPDFLSSLPPAEFSACIAARDTRFAQEEQDAIATSQSSDAIFPTVPPVVLPLQTPKPRGYISERARRVERMSMEDRREIPPIMVPYGANDAWQLGALSGSDGSDYAVVLLFCYPKNDTRGPVLILTEYSTEDPVLQQIYNQYWLAPADLTALTVSGFESLLLTPAGPTGSMHFTTPEGKTGTFDLATQAWTFQ